MKCKAISIKEIVELLRPNDTAGRGPEFVDDIAPISSATGTSFSWLSPDRKDRDRLIAESDAGVVVMGDSEDFEPKPGQLFIKVSNPKLSYIKALSVMCPMRVSAGIHPTAVISPEAKIHPSVSVGAYSVIEDCEIGEGTVIGTHCRIGEGTRIGRFVNIASGVVIGTDGFGYVEDEDGNRVKFPHIGGVLIEDNVDIGSNTCIDRGTLSDTIVRAGAKIDNLVHVGHNALIGRNAMVIAHATLGGSAIIGEGAWIAPGSTIRDGIAIGDRTLVGIGSVVIKTLPDNQVWAGNPARQLEKKTTSG